MDNVGKFLREIKVYDCNLTKMRIGDERDGGYVALKELCKKTDVLYTFGVGDDVGFEMDFVKRFPVKEVRLHDHSINCLPVDHPKFNFFSIEVGRCGQALDDIWLSGFSRAILKMDVEWDEWEILKQVSDKGLQKYNQLLIEFHIVKISNFVESGYSPYFRAFMGSTYEKINEKLFAM